jgi:hypothetical protein
MTECVLVELHVVCTTGVVLRFTGPKLTVQAQHGNHRPCQGTVLPLACSTTLPQAKHSTVQAPTTLLQLQTRQWQCHTPAQAPALPNHSTFVDSQPGCRCCMQQQAGQQCQYIKPQCCMQHNSRIRFQQGLGPCAAQTTSTQQQLAPPSGVKVCQISSHRLHTQKNMSRHHTKLPITNPTDIAKLCTVTPSYSTKPAGLWAPDPRSYC